MDTLPPKTFHCAVIDPTGKLLDCETPSAVFPAHDGQVGILRDHMPMLSQLGLGILKVAVMDRDEEASQKDLLFFVDGGFALVAVNSVTIVAYEAFALHGVTAERLASLIRKAEEDLAGTMLSAGQRLHQRERLLVLRRIASMAEQDRS